MIIPRKIYVSMINVILDCYIRLINVLSDINAMSLNRISKMSDYTIMLKSVLQVSVQKRRYENM